MRRRLLILWIVVMRLFIWLVLRVVLWVVLQVTLMRMFCVLLWALMVLVWHFLSFAGTETAQRAVVHL